MKYGVLGPLLVEASSGTVSLGGPKQRSVLAMLVLDANHVVSIERLVDGLWGDRPPERAVGAIQVYVHKLRRLLDPLQGGDVVASERPGYVLRADADDIDVLRFETFVSEAHQKLAGGAAEDASRCLSRATSLWRGPVLADLASQPFAPGHISRLEELRLGALERRIEIDLTLGRHAQLTRELRDLVAENPWHERFAAQLAIALYRAGRQADALRAIALTRNALIDELGIDLGAELQELELKILQHDASLDLEDSANRVAEVRPFVEFPRRLPRAPSLLDPTVGRDSELEDLSRLVADEGVRLLNIVGPGGVGKTRVAVALANRLATHFSDDVSFVALGDAERPADVAPIICGAFGIRAGDDPMSVVLQLFSDRRALIVFDNFEHVTDAAPLLARLLAAAPRVQVVVTSRHGLALQGERRYQLAPLACDSRDQDPSHATALFIERAVALDPSFEPTPSELDDIDAIARHCDGIPLALELAAARTRVFTIGELREIVANSALDITAPVNAGRHHTLRQSIAASVSYLASPDAEFLARLSVFRGGFTLKAAAFVTTTPLDATIERVDELIDRSLLHHRAITASQRRFDMLQTIRSFLIDEISVEDRDAVRHLHARYFRDATIDLADVGGGPFTADRWAVLLPEQPNLRAAIRWAMVAGDEALSADLVVAVSGMWGRLGLRGELSGWLDHVLTLQSVHVSRRIDALMQRGWICENTGELDEMARCVAEAERLANETGDELRKCWVRGLAVWHAFLADDLTNGAELVAGLRRLLADHDMPVHLRCWLQNVSSLSRSFFGDFEGALSEGQAMRELAETHGLDYFELLALNNMCEYGLVLGRPAQAAEWSELGMQRALLSDYPREYADFMSQRGAALLDLGAVTEAHDAFLQCIELHLGDGSLNLALDDLVRLAAACAARGEFGRAAKLEGVFEGVIEAFGLLQQPGQKHTREKYLARAREGLGGTYEERINEGKGLVRRLGATSAMEEALTWTGSINE